MLGITRCLLVHLTPQQGAASSRGKTSPDTHQTVLPQGGPGDQDISIQAGHLGHQRS